MENLGFKNVWCVLASYLICIEMDYYRYNFYFLT